MTDGLFLSEADLGDANGERAVEAPSGATMVTFPDRRAWLEARRSGIGGSDVAAILGKSPWRGALAVWLDKRGLADDSPAPIRMRAGNALEPLVAEIYRERMGTAFAPLKPYTIFRREAWELATPDRLVLGDIACGVEIKTTRSASGWGEDGSDTIPEHYGYQVAWYAAVTGLMRWDVAALFGAAEYRQFRLEFSAEQCAALREAVAEWWGRHIVRGEQPPIDGSGEARSWLAQAFPRNEKPLRAANLTEARTLGRLAAARAAAEAAEAECERLGNEVRAAIGDADGIECECARATWRRTKDGVEVDKDAYIRALESALLGAGHSPGQLAMIRKEFSIVRPGVRRFLFTPAREE